MSKSNEMLDHYHDFFGQLFDIGKETVYPSREYCTDGHLHHFDKIDGSKDLYRCSKCGEEKEIR